MSACPAEENGEPWVLERLELLNRDQFTQIILDQHGMIEVLPDEIEQEICCISENRKRRTDE